MTGVFVASYPTRCPCGEYIEPGDGVFYEQAVLFREECCGVPEASVPVTERTTITPDPLSKVMPRGAKAADRCGTCFQIPAANGVCGCDRG